MIFNVGAGGTTDADKIKYGDSNVGATLDELQEDVSELNESLGGLSLLEITQADYDALATKDTNTLYLITE